MTILLLFLIFGLLAITLLDGNWEDGLTITILIGFLQDPIRKITPGQPQLMVGLFLVAFLLTAIVLNERAQKYSQKAMFWNVPELTSWIPIYFGLIGFQALNSLYRFGNPLLSLVGASFYLAPALGLWTGFQIGCRQTLLVKLLKVYLIASIIWAITVFMSYRGVDNILLKEVGKGIEIVFRYGFHARGASGLWRTSEIASWHLATASCISITLAFASSRSQNQNALLALGTGFAFLTILTGRRKALVLVLSFAAIYLLLFSRRASPASRERILTSILGIAGISYATYSFLLIGLLGENFGEYLNRSISVQNDLTSRFDDQGIKAALRAFEISDGIGLGAGAAATTGGINLGGVAKASIRSLNYVSEGGGGRVIAELGIPGMIIITVLLFMLGMLIFRNFRMLKQLPQQSALLMVGMLSIILANIPSFFTAAQLYGDPFVLIILSICMGSYLATPVIAAKYQDYLAYQQNSEHDQQLSPSGPNQI
ncbi:MAG: hypothetical protein ACK531_03500 [Cyanobacteriota bacterium]|jgi:hypothetical protein